MLGEEYGWKENEGKGDTVKQIQEILRSGKHMTPNGLNRQVLKQVNELENRLLQVRRWGGAFSEIEFSPDVQMLLNQKCRSRKSQAIIL